MMMFKRSLSGFLVAFLTTCGFGATNASAGTVYVNADSGYFNFTLTSTGNGSFSVLYSVDSLTSINGGGIAGGPVTGDIVGTPPGSHTGIYDVTSTIPVVPGTFTSYTLAMTTTGEKIYGEGPGAISTAELRYEFTNATAINPGFLNITGYELPPLSTTLQTVSTGETIYDFSAFNAGGSISRTFTSVGANFAEVIAHGGTIMGSGAFSDIAAVAAVPEPASAALLGIGVLGVFVIRRSLKRNVSARQDPA